MDVGVAMLAIALLSGPAWLRTGPATDSASAATAMATGCKTRTGNIAWNAGDLPGDSLEAFTEILGDSLGYAIGIVTTVPFSHATPAAFISHDPDRDHYYSGASGNDLPGISEDIILGSRPAVCIGDGMGPVQEEAASLFLHRAGGMMAWQDSTRFPFRCRVATWDIDTYDARALALGLPVYSPDCFDPGVASP